MKVYWLQQNASNVPTFTGWLSANEAVRLNSMRVPKRRSDWTLGRWTAKLALAAYLQIPDDSQVLAQIELRPEPSGAPVAYCADRPAGVTISLSHSCNIAISAVTEFGAAMGCDLESVAPRSDAFVRDYFTGHEQEMIALENPANRQRLTASLWSAKESALKAMRTGLREDTRSIEVSVESGWETGAVADGECRDGLQVVADRWHPLRATSIGRKVFHGWALESGSFVLTIVADPFPDPPVQLRCDSILRNSAEGSFLFSKASVNAA
jgi:4'-phosphopantetheinyl transferase